jgi:hypothetical protein
MPSLPRCSMETEANTCLKRAKMLVDPTNRFLDLSSPTSPRAKPYRKQKGVLQTHGWESEA